MWVDVPGKGPHPAVVLVDLGGAFIVANSSSSPQDEDPVVSLSPAAAKRCGLVAASNGQPKDTKFYGARRFIWYWRPPPGTERVGELFPTARADVAVAVFDTLKTMKLSEIQCLPDGAGFTLAQMKAMRPFVVPVGPIGTTS